MVPEQAEKYYESYAALSRVVRGWLVGYGIGAPVLFLSQEKAAAALAAAPNSDRIMLAFVLGAALQVGSALFYKSVLAYMYFGEIPENESFRDTRRYKFANQIYKMHLPELAVDLVSTGAFAWATYQAFKALC